MGGKFICFDYFALDILHRANIKIFIINDKMPGVSLRYNIIAMGKH